MSGPVVIMAGGTGGHIFPGLAVAQELRQRQVDVLWLGSVHGMENALVPAQGIAIERLTVSGLRGRSWRTLALAPLRLSYAVFQALRVLRRHAPRSVLSMGGFAAGPGGVAAWLLRRPLLVHEQNSVPGLTNRLLARVARRVFGGFPDAFGGGSEHVGNPVRADIARLPEPEQRFRGRAATLRLLVLGGSQGAKALNEVLPAAAALTGSDDAPRGSPSGVRRPLTRKRKPGRHYAALKASPPGWSAFIVRHGARPTPGRILSVCRAGRADGGGARRGGRRLRSYVPFPHAVDDHQTHNARFHGRCRLRGAAGTSENELSAESLNEAASAEIPDGAARCGCLSHGA